MTFFSLFLSIFTIKNIVFLLVFLGFCCFFLFLVVSNRVSNRLSESYFVFFFFETFFVSFYMKDYTTTTAKHLATFNAFKWHFIVFIDTRYFDLTRYLTHMNTFNLFKVFQFLRQKNI